MGTGDVVGRFVRRALAPTVLATVMTAGLAAGLTTPAVAQEAPPAPTPTEPGIHPGVMTHTDGAQCTSNFVFTDGSGTYLGQAAHCSGTGGATQTNGCESGSLPLGTPVTIDGATRPGTLVYNSWLAMQSAGEDDPDACAHNDFALVKIDPADVDSVSAAVPFFGGPSGLDTDGTRPGETVRSYGNSQLRGGVTLLSPKFGTSLGDSANGWTHSVATVTPGIPGDSGSAFLSSDGTALGVLSTLNLAPVPASNGVSDLSKMLDYARDHGFGGLELVRA